VCLPEVYQFFHPWPEVVGLTVTSIMGPVWKGFVIKFFYHGAVVPVTV
jgi:hypothetical protein